MINKYFLKINGYDTTNNKLRRLLSPDIYAIDGDGELNKIVIFKYNYYYVRKENYLNSILNIKSYILSEFCE